MPATDTPGTDTPGTDTPGTDALAADTLELVYDADPLLPTLMGDRRRDDLLADLSEEGEHTVRARAVELLGRLDALGAGESPAAPSQERVTRSFAAQQLRSMIELIDARTVEFSASDTLGAPVPGLLTLLPMITLGDRDQAENYLTRLRAIPRYLEQAATRHEAGLAAGRLPVARLAKGAVALVDRYLAAPEADPLSRPTPPEGGTDLTGFRAERDRILADLVRPAFAAYRRAVDQELAPHGRSDDAPGLCWLPDGEASYDVLTRYHTTLDGAAAAPERLHDIGLNLIRELAEEYAEVGERVFGTTDVAEIFRRMREDPALRWRDADELLTFARAAVRRAEATAPNWFGRLPEASCVVEAVPDTEAPSAPPAYYLWPSLDGTRPGTYFANTYRATERVRHTAEATAFHEAVPGHHFQLSVAQRLDHLPLLRRIATVTSYAEGWGVYAERLADEMGLYSDDVARLGMLSNDSMRAARLVLDTGLHAKGWSRQQAVDYAREHTPMAVLEVETEVDRYIGEPGQALSYMVGRLEIQRIRRAAERALGDRFDIRGFHDTVLGSGSLPLTTLGEVVSDWVNANRYAR